MPLQVYAVAMKSIRYAAKNVQEMSRELSAIAAVTTATAELTEKLHEAEQMKAETEARLNERVRGTLKSLPWIVKITELIIIVINGFMINEFHRSYFPPPQNAMLQEMSEEWDQCEHKLKESRDWTDKARANLDSPANRNKPIRDQGGPQRTSIK